MNKVTVFHERNVDKCRFRFDGPGHWSFGFRHRDTKTRKSKYYWITISAVYMLIYDTNTGKTESGKPNETFYHNTYQKAPPFYDDYPTVTYREFIIELTKAMKIALTFKNLTPKVKHDLNYFYSELQNTPIVIEGMML